MSHGNISVLRDGQSLRYTEVAFRELTSFRRALQRMAVQYYEVVDGLRARRR